MKTIFSQQEIQQALVNYMELQGIVIKDRNISVSFTKGRKVDSLEAVVDIEDPSNIFAGTQPEPVVEEVAEVAPPAQEEPVEAPEPEEVPQASETQPWEEAPQEGASVPSDALPKSLFQRD